MLSPRMDRHCPTLISKKTVTVMTTINIFTTMEESLITNLIEEIVTLRMLKSIFK